MVERIVSFLPSATEIICAIGLGKNLRAVSHECDFPPEVKNKPVIVRPSLPLEHMTLSEIDRAVTERLRNGQSLYNLDETLLQKIAPDLIVTQDLCQVCAPSEIEVSRAIRHLPVMPNLLCLTPKSLADIFDNIRSIAKATDCMPSAEVILASAVARLERVTTRLEKIRSRPRVFCMEWVDPVYCAGHWVPEMVESAGGEDSLSRRGADSVRIEWTKVVDYKPEVLVLMPCGFGLKKAYDVAKLLPTYQGWRDLPAVRNNRVYIVDANSYFARPGPRVVEGTELLAHLFHPDVIDWSGPSEAFACFEG